MKMENHHFCPRHFSHWFKLQISLDHACTCIKCSNPFYTPKLNANTLENGFVLSFRALYIDLFHLWQKVYIAILIKHALCNFVYLEPWT